MKRKNVNYLAKTRVFSPLKKNSRVKRSDKNRRLRVDLLVDSAVSLSFCKTHRHSHHQCRKACKTEKGEKS